jgi:hypothetical protein
VAVKKGTYPLWKYYPPWRPRPEWVERVVGVVRDLESQIDSRAFIRSKHQTGPVVHEILRPHLELLDYVIEAPKTRGTNPLLRRPVLYGEGPTKEKYFDLDGWNSELQIALEIEGSAALENKNALWDLMKFCVVTDAEYGVIIVPQEYHPVKQRYTAPYLHIRGDFDMLYSNPERFRIPLQGLLLVGY